VKKARRERRDTNTAIARACSPGSGKSRTIKAIAEGIVKAALRSSNGAGRVVSVQENVRAEEYEDVPDSSHASKGEQSGLFGDEPRAERSSSDPGQAADEDPLRLPLRDTRQSAARVNFPPHAESRLTMSEILPAVKRPAARLAAYL
jgi:hypothetical protein